MTFQEKENKQRIAALSEKREANRKNSYKKKSKFHRPPAKFDPNAYTEKEWMALGLSEKQVGVVLKFTKNGIRSNEDLQRIFVISEELFELIKDSTVYPQKEYGAKNNFSEKKADPQKPQIVSVELNTADAQELEAIPGIGSYLSKMILERRAKLGGFVTKSQLLEIYRFDQEKLDAVDKYIRINPEIIEKLNINEVTIEQLKNHPYIEYKVANSIVKMRQQKGSYSRLDELKESVLINEELFQKLKPYVYL
ncbi:MAG: helix-hairpin-helix domain-containing protein [Crocinitomicaceae bacterium]